MEEPTRERTRQSGTPKWMITFADLNCLLLAFFILMFSFSSMDSRKYKEMAEHMQTAFGGKKEVNLDVLPKGRSIIDKHFEAVPLDVRVRLDEVLATDLSAGFVEAEHSVEGLTLRVKTPVAFAPGSAKIELHFEAFLNRLGKIVSEMEIHVSVSGHTDNLLTEKDSFSSNWELSASRAVRIIEYWQSHFAIPSERLAAFGYADAYPIASNDTEEGRGRNRRVEFLIRPHKPRYAFEGIKIMDR